MIELGESGLLDLVTLRSNPSTVMVIKAKHEYIENQIAKITISRKRSSREKTGDIHIYISITYLILLQSQ